MAENKQIKLSIVVDDASFSQAKIALQGLVKELTTVIETSTKLQSVMAGHAGAHGNTVDAMMTGVMGTTPSGVQRQASAPSLPQMVNVGVSTPTGFVDKVAQTTNAFKAASTSGVDALRTMSDAVRSSADSQVRELTRISQAAEKAAQSYSQLRGGGLPGMTAPPPTSPAAAAHNASLNAMAAMQRPSSVASAAAGGGGGGGASLGGAGAATAGPGGSAPAEDGNPWGANWWNRRGGLVGGVVGGMLSGGGIGGVVGGAIGGGLQMLGMAANPAALVGGAAVGAYNYAAGAYYDIRKANLQDRIQREMDMPRLGATLGDTLGQSGMGMVLGGDVAGSIAMRSVMRSDSARFLLGDAGRREMAGINAGYTYTLGAANSRLKAFIGGDVLGGGFDPRLMRYAREVNYGIPTDQIEKLHELAQAQQRATPMLSAMANQVWSGAQGDVSLQRSMGIGGTIKNLSGPPSESPTVGALQAALIEEQLKKQPATASAFTRYREALMSAGFSDAEGAQVRQALAAQAGRGNMGVSNIGLLSAQAGGLANGVQLVAAGAQYNTNAASLFGAAQSGIGRGGVDITAGSQIASAVAAQMLGGNWLPGTTGNAAMRGLLSVAHTGDTGTDMRMARMLNQGLAAPLGAGSNDPLQGAIDVVASNQAAGNLSQYARRAMRGVSSTQMIDILRSGKVPMPLQKFGLTAENFSKYEKEREGYLLSRYVDTGDNSDVGKAVRQYKNTGSLAGIDMQALAMGLSQAGGMSYEDAYGRLMAIQASDSGLSPNLHGRGAHDVTDPNSPERQALRAKGKQLRKAEQEKLKGLPQIEEGMKNMPIIGEQLLGLGKTLTEGTVDLQDALGKLVDTINEATRNLGGQPTRTRAAAMSSQ